MDIKLRPYQIQAMDALNNFQKRGKKRALMVLATGTGKRIMAIWHSQGFNKILFICHTEELIDQARIEFENFYPMQVGIVKANRFEIDFKVTIASAQTLHRRLNKMPKNLFDLIIVDEAHFFLAKTYLEPLHYFEPKMLTGWTATPTRLDGLNMSNIFEEIVFDYSIQRGIKEGYLCQLDAYRIKTQCDLSSLKKLGGDFKLNELSDKVDTNERNQLIVNKYKEYANGKQALANCVDIKHAERLRDTFKANGISCEMIVSDKELCPNREYLVKEFKAGRIQIITNVVILSVGFDYSDVGCILMARPTQSKALYMQMIGRGTRLKSPDYIWNFNRNECIILDIVDVSGKHELVNTWSLEEGVRIEDRIFMNEERRQRLIEKRDADNRDRQAKVDKIINKDSRIVLFPLPECIVPFYMLSSSDPATPNQIEYMKRIGIWQDDVEYTKGQATEIISTACASDAQIWKLNKLGYDISKGVSRGQAKLAFEDAEKRGLIERKPEYNKTPFKL